MLELTKIYLNQMTFMVYHYFMIDKAVNHHGCIFKNREVRPFEYLSILLIFAAK